MAKKIVTNLHELVSNVSSAYIYANKEEFKSETPGPAGPRGLPGADGIDGTSVEITSVINNPNKSLTINFSDGTQHTTDPLKGQDGTSITVNSVDNNDDGTITINFSDGTSHTTQNLQGSRGFKGDTGDHVHHISYQRSKDPLGNEVGPVEPGQPGYDDTYAMWTSQEELPEMFIGEFVVHNGLNTLTGTEQLKFDSIEFGATSDQAAVDVPFDNSGTGFVADNVQTALVELESSKEDKSNKGVPNGYAGLDGNGLVPSTQLPSYVDDVLEYATYADLPVTGEEGKIYVVIADETSGNDTSSYRWTGTIYAMVSNTLTAADIKELYESNANTNEFTDDEKTKLTNTEVTSQLNDRDTANRDRANHTGTQDLGTITETVDKKIMTSGERTKLGAIEDGATADQTAEEIEALYEGLSDTNKYTDAEKSRIDINIDLTTTAQTLPTAINEIDSRVADMEDNTTLAEYNITDAYTKTESNTNFEPKNANIQSHISSTANPHGVTKAQVGLNNVDNTSDANKPISTATQTALNLKADKSSTYTKTEINNYLALKLDTSEYTAIDVLNKITTVDGSGSGVDADLLDGQEGAYYLNASNINTGTINDAHLPDTITSNIIGNAATATKLATARRINGVSFDGTANIVAPTNLTVGTRTTTAVPIESSSGTNASIPAATTTLAGVMSSADKGKLDGIAANANNYTLPTATATVKGGIEIFSDTVQTVASNTVSTTAGRTYGIQLNADGQAVVNVPWVSTSTTITVENVLTSTSTTNALSAAQGKELNTTKANINSPTFTGVPKAPTASIGTSTTQLATTAFVLNELNKIEEW